MDSTKSKKQLISKANSTMVAVVAVGSFLTIFSFVACRNLWVIRSHQAKVVDKKAAAVKQLEENKEKFKKLEASFSVFMASPDNIIGGSPTGTGDRDGDNARIVLDALPSKYDFPAFITSVNKLLSTKSLTATSITGTDDEVAQKDSKSETPVEIPFVLGGEANSFQQAKDFMLALEQSIRPVNVKKITITAGKSSQIQLNVDAASYYLPAKGVTVKKETIKQ